MTTASEHVQANSGRTVAALSPQGKATSFPQRRQWCSLLLAVALLVDSGWATKDSYQTNHDSATKRRRRGRAVGNNPTCGKAGGTTAGTPARATTHGTGNSTFNEAADPEHSQRPWEPTASAAAHRQPTLPTPPASHGSQAHMTWPEWAWHRQPADEALTCSQA